MMVLWSSKKNDGTNFLTWKLINPQDFIAVHILAGVPIEAKENKEEVGILIDAQNTTYYLQLEQKIY